MDTKVQFLFCFDTNYHYLFMNFNKNKGTVKYLITK